MNRLPAEGVSFSHEWRMFDSEDAVTASLLRSRFTSNQDVVLVSVMQFTVTQDHVLSICLDDSLFQSLSEKLTVIFNNRVVLEKERSFCSINNVCFDDLQTFFRVVRSQFQLPGIEFDVEFGFSRLF